MELLEDREYLILQVLTRYQVFPLDFAVFPRNKNKNDDFQKIAIPGFIIVDKRKLIFKYTLGPFIGQTGPSSDSLKGREWSGLTLWLMILPRSSLLVGRWSGGEEG